MIQFDDFKRQLELIKASEMQLYRFLDEMPVGTLVIDKNFRIVFLSQSFTRVLGYAEKDKSILQSFKDLAPFLRNEHSSFSIDAELMAALKEGRSMETDIIHFTNVKNENFFLRVLTQPVYCDDSRKFTPDFVLVIFDIVPPPFHYFLSELLRWDGASYSFDTFTEWVSQKLCTYLQVNRVGFWLNKPSYIECVSLFDLEARENQKGIQIFKKDFPVYFEHVSKGKVLAAEDAMRQEISREFADIYFAPLDIHSTLDCPIFVNNTLYALICCEMFHKKRKWQRNEVEFIQDSTKLIGWVIEHYYAGSNMG